MEEPRCATFVGVSLVFHPSHENEAPEKLFVAPGAARETRHEAIAQFLPHPVEAERIRWPTGLVLRRLGPEKAVEHAHARIIRRNPLSGKLSRSAGLRAPAAAEVTDEQGVAC
jgi:hypothetical protein